MSGDHGCRGSRQTSHGFCSYHEPSAPHEGAPPAAAHFRCEAGTPGSSGTEQGASQDHRQATSQLLGKAGSRWSWTAVCGWRRRRREPAWTRLVTSDAVRMWLRHSPALQEVPVPRRQQAQEAEVFGRGAVTGAAQQTQDVQAAPGLGGRAARRGRRPRRWGGRRSRRPESPVEPARGTLRGLTRVLLVIHRTFSRAAGGPPCTAAAGMSRLCHLTVLSRCWGRGCLMARRSVMGTRPGRVQTMVGRPTTRVI